MLMFMRRQPASASQMCIPPRLLGRPSFAAFDTEAAVP
jgi:hypothetical protein